MIENQNSQFENGSEESEHSASGYSYVFSNGQGAGNVPPHKQPKEPKRGGVSAKVLVLTVVTCVIFSLFAGIGGAWYMENHRTVDDPEVPGSTARQTEDTTSPSHLFSANPEQLLDKSESQSSVYGSAGVDVFAVSTVVRKVQDAVVVIDATVMTTSMFGQSSTSVSSGSGVVISENGYILTCHHVVDGAKSVKVTLNDGTAYDATLVGSDSASDLAVLKIDPKDQKLVYAEQGCSGDLVVGESVVAIGNPLGTLGGTVTTGIISATERNIQMSDGSTMTLIQTDAAINSGNSGGGLFNLNGQLIGIVNAKYSASGVEGLAFAIPIDSAYEVQLQLIQYGYVRGVIDHGLTVLEVTDNELSYYHYYFGLTQTGVYIVDSEYTDELKNKDLILSIGGKTVATEDDFDKILEEYVVGDTVTFEISRDGKTMEVSLELREYVPDRLKDSLN